MIAAFESGTFEVSSGLSVSATESIVRPEPDSLQFIFDFVQLLVLVLLLFGYPLLQAPAYQTRSPARENVSRLSLIKTTMYT